MFFSIAVSRDAPTTPIAITCSRDSHNTPKTMKKIMQGVIGQEASTLSICDCARLVSIVLEDQTSVIHARLHNLAPREVILNGQGARALVFDPVAEQYGYVGALTHSKTSLGIHEALPVGPEARLLYNVNRTDLPAVGPGAKRCREGTLAGICKCPAELMSPVDLAWGGYVQASFSDWNGDEPPNDVTACHVSGK